ncbi:MAG TPA: transposase [Clostridia bacterium]|jgi:putative transposase|nr:transposase [Clostridia bacterium]
MPRVAREKSKTGIYHIILRAVNRQMIFEEDEDAIKFLETLERYKETSGYEIYAYCLMGNHVHILLKEGKEDLGVTMRRIGASYVYWYNWKYERVGHLFQDRYKSEVVETEKYLLAVLRYIHQNPLKAGLVKDLKLYKWSSYNEYINGGTITDIDFVLDLFDVDRNRAKLMFKKFHEKKSSINCLDIEEKRQIKDGEAAKMIKQICQVSHCSDIQRMNILERDNCLRKLKEEGLSARQIARLTGLSRYIITKT